MMILLPGNVAGHGADLRFADREGSVPGLPAEALDALLFHPAGGDLLQLLDDLGDAARSRQREERVDMIRGSTGLHRRAVEVLKDPSEVRMRCTPHLAMNQRLPVLGAEDEVDQNSRERLDMMTTHALSGLVVCGGVTPRALP